MLNEATKNAFVTEMARYNTHARKKWQVLSHVNLKLPSHPQPCGLNHVQQGGEDDQ